MASSNHPTPVSAEREAEHDMDPDLVQAFRPAKKRKVFRARHASPPADAELSSDPSPPAVIPSSVDGIAPGDNLDADTLTALRRRQQATKLRRTKGMEFWSGSTETAKLENDRKSATEPQDNAPSLVGGSRFTPQTGHTTQVDQHMMAYVDAEIVRRRRSMNWLAQETMRLRLARARDSGDASGATMDEGDTHEDKDHEDENDHDDIRPQHDAAAGSSAPPKLPARQPATLGKIQEVALPAGSSIPQDVPPKRERPPRVRRGRDGRVLPPRRRARRGSADLARDALVESLMHENRPETFASAGFANATHEEEALTDDALAEKFKLEWADHRANEERKRENRAQDKNTQEERLKGPKLGGSRSQRIAVREKELEAQREREKGKKR